MRDALTIRDAETGHRLLFWSAVAMAACYLAGSALVSGWRLLLAPVLGQVLVFSVAAAIALMRSRRRWSARTAWKWLLSFSKREWELADYPVVVRLTTSDYADVDVPANTWQAAVEQAWMYGYGETPDAARADLACRFAEYRAAEGRPPRPGRQWPLRFAATDLIDRHRPMARELLRRLFDVDIDEGFVSDESSLWDFHGDASCDAYVARIEASYGVDVSDIEDLNLVRICETLERRA